MFVTTYWLRFESDGEEPFKAGPFSTNLEILEMEIEMASPDFLSTFPMTKESLDSEEIRTLSPERVQITVFQPTNSHYMPLHIHYQTYRTS